MVVFLIIAGFFALFAGAATWAVLAEAQPKTGIKISPRVPLPASDLLTFNRRGSL
jgi:hypothetical protein